MATNMGKIDRGLRLVIAAALLFVAFGTAMLGSGILFWIALVVAGVFTLTAFVGNCPLYRIVGLKTCQDC
ncbi:DUF2892 domain-containing protein [Sulfitobacter sp. M57]|uniref:YgaP family membrane protein n=1 Tax=unclassified Sulfitobacter TaxID=196795 RepID=UPI0023E32401|nr:MULTISPECIES: DUF2892 domain-containing protein [unclassified Sulfitobacter]MDF3416122.1 DUF2892 domain-containing protein [Sulfitobacter sp. KE5]MDF3423601.1 DUF2892 domain-containing protein [Sulfitobacter sp. KE43]MDF3434597.1 DUF2892 domain-containing protein [Sulfitobacter sp. KE42]MDF3460307.1 DUF2892 domain-containing protein [Sulfitobacter sp. S74]MDF3464135.1 DUF2892 domain-containing protein [Sulfitobacter sp. Ks18]